MTVRLRVVLDQLAAPTDPDLQAASRDLARMLVESAPGGCVVDAIAPAGEPLAVPGIRSEKRLSIGRRELVAAWRMGVAAGADGGLVHSPTLLAPLVRHDRANDAAQTVVTLWDLRAWEAQGELPKGAAGLQHALLKRAQRHADALVVPSHAIAVRLAERADLGARVRVIPGAPPEGFSLPTDAEARRRDLALPERFVATSGGAAPSDGLATAFAAARAADRDVVVLDAPDGQGRAVREIAASTGLAADRVHVRGALDRGDRAAVMGHAGAFVAGSARAAWPWRAVEAMSLGTPVVAVDSDGHREVVFDGGAVVGADDMGDALVAALDGEEERMRVLALDRARAFSWHGAAEMVWQLHAEL
ncbi:glycosyltransferase [Microbacterium betulae]|uniref:Glycosyltransferase n=1 Tax=Microbacterium betulae TaxID=2981139 RepID=A0AA97FJE8_9MICO|nr:glycosyltransferase [Microbacterium sp. AB]WOF24160.1 glycosyltransferase [Microbacterium sp. AB]